MLHTYVESAFPQSTTPQMDIADRIRIPCVTKRRQLKLMKTCNQLSRGKGYCGEDSNPHTIINCKNLELIKTRTQPPGGKRHNGLYSSASYTNSVHDTCTRLRLPTHRPMHSSAIPPPCFISLFFSLFSLLHTPSPPRLSLSPTLLLCLLLLPLVVVYGLYEGALIRWK